MAMQGVIWMSLASACIAYTISEARIFLPLRLWVGKKSDFFCHMISCGFCLGFYVAFTLEIIFQPNLFSIPIIGHLLTSFIISWLSGVQWVIMCILIKKADK
jgi:uncharacterized membrane protein (DUF485 family)